MQNLQKAKLRDVIGNTITIEKIFEKTGEFGDYAILVTASQSILAAGKVLSTVHELSRNLPATVTVKKGPGKFDPFVLE